MVFVDLQAASMRPASFPQPLGAAAAPAYLKAICGLTFRRRIDIMRQSSWRGTAAPQAGIVGDGFSFRHAPADRRESNFMPPRGQRRAKMGAFLKSILALAEGTSKRCGVRAGGRIGSIAPRVAPDLCKKAFGPHSVIIPSRLYGRIGARVRAGVFL